jgi:hypothetical protein
MICHFWYVLEIAPTSVPTTKSLLIPRLKMSDVGQSSPLRKPVLPERCPRIHSAEPIRRQAGLR